MKWSTTIGRFAGIDVKVHATFLLILIWVAITHWQAGKYATRGIGSFARSPSLSRMSRFEALSRAPSRGGLESQFRQQWGEIIEEGTGLMLDLAFEGVSGQVLSAFGI